MTYDPIDTGPNDSDADRAVTLDDLDIGTADFVATGDFLPLLTWNNVSKNDLRTTSTTYDDSIAHSQCIVPLTDMPSNVQLQAALYCLVRVGTDETVDVRLRNVNDGETLVEKTGITSTAQVKIGPTDYNPPSPGLINAMRVQAKLSNGVNTSGVDEFLAVIGIGL